MENIDRLIPVFDRMVGDGMMTLEKADVITYRARGERSTAVVDDRLRTLGEQARAMGSLEDGESEGVAALASSILAAHQDGATQAQIVEASGMTAERVREILKGSIPPDQPDET